jgi:hypothetical protein
MQSHHEGAADTREIAMSQRSNALAEVLEQGVRAMIAFASTLTDAEWKTPVPHDGRTVGVVVHHVASIMPLEIDVATMIAGGKTVTDVTWDAVHQINATHAQVNRDATKDEALDLLRKNSSAATATIRSLSDAQLDRAVPNSMYADAPLTCQFFLEDHAVRHSYHHLAKLRAALRK